jgi:hypothetical protein
MHVCCNKKSSNKNSTFSACLCTVNSIFLYINSRNFSVEYTDQSESGLLSRYSSATIVFCFLSSFTLYPPPPSHHRSVWLLPAISLLLTNSVSPDRACLYDWWRGFVGAKKKTSIVLLCSIPSSVPYRLQMLAARGLQRDVVYLC